MSCWDPTETSKGVSGQENVLETVSEAILVVSGVVSVRASKR